MKVTNERDSIFTLNYRAFRVLNVAKREYFEFSVLWIFVDLIF